MGWKGTLRSFNASIRAAERESQRRQRELAKRQKQYEKMEELEKAAYEVDVFENHIEIIQSLHKESSKTIDWNKIILSKPPKEPINNNKNEKISQDLLDSYKPNLIDRLFKKENKKIESLNQALDAAKKLDESNYKSAITEWEKDTQEWKEEVELAKKIQSGDGHAKLQALKNLDPYSEISNLGSKIGINLFDNNLVGITIYVKGTEIVPTESKSLLKSGKLSVKKMPNGRFNEIYQDYVCSCILRIANEFFAIIPDQLVIVTAIDNLLNTQTGHMEDTPIVSAAISRSTMDNLNLEDIDPSDSMTNFIHNMSFKKTKGFERVDPISPDGLECR